MNSSSEWYEMFYRGYDPAIGRMMQVDPMAVKYGTLSPFNYSFNNPVVFNDPLGDDPTPDQLWGKLLEIYYSLGAGERAVISGEQLMNMAGEPGGSSSGGDGATITQVWNPWWQADDSKKPTGKWMNLASVEGLIFYLNKRDDPRVKVRKVATTEQQGTQQVESYLTMLRSNFWDGGGWDWILETTRAPISGAYVYVQRAVIITYDTKGNKTGLMTRQRTYRADSSGGYDPYGGPIEYSYQQFHWSPDLLGLSLASVNLNCGQCNSDGTVAQKWIDFILKYDNSPGPFSPKPPPGERQMRAVTGPYK